MTSQTVHTQCHELLTDSTTNCSYKVLTHGSQTVYTRCHKLLTHGITNCAYKLLTHGVINCLYTLSPANCSHIPSQTVHAQCQKSFTHGVTNCFRPEITVMVDWPLTTTSMLTSAVLVRVMTYLHVDLRCTGPSDELPTS